MKILHLEDMSEVTFILAEKFLELGHFYKEAVSLYEMDELLSKDKYDCLIMDINLSPAGLPPILIKETQEGKISGWIWIKNVAIPTYGIDPRDIIIYSDYIYLLEGISDKKLDDIIKIPKRKAGKRESSVSELEKAVISINNRKR